MKLSLLAAASLAVLGWGTAHAACPPLAAYQVSNITLSGNLEQADSALFSGTAWSVQTGDEGARIPVDMQAVGGPLDKVLNAVVAKANSSEWRVTTLADSTSCTVHVDVTARTPKPVVTQSPAPPTGKPEKAPVTAHAVAIGTTGHSATGTAHAITVEPGAYGTKAATQAPTWYTLPAHELLSKALATYVKARGWTLKWNVSEDYMLEAPFPIPHADNVIAGVSYVVHAYKAQGAMLGVTLLFAKPNHVVAMLPTAATINTSGDHR